MLQRLRRPVAAEDGIALVELVGALTILAVGFLALAAGMTSGFRQVSLGRQRQSAAEVANSRVEHLRNVPFDQVALSTDVAYDSDPDHPDHFVHPTDNTFDYTGNGDWETLIEDTTNGQVTHFESPVVVGTTTLTVFQYVTWVDDPDIAGSQNYKRVTVVVQFDQPAVGSGGGRLVRASSFFTTDVVTLGGTTPGAGVGTTGPSASPSPTPSPTATGCTTDTSAPTGDFSVQGGSVAEIGYTASTSVTISYPGLADACPPIYVRFSNDGATYSSDITYDSVNPSIAWTLTAADGSKSVWGKFRDSKGNERTVGPKTIVLDSTKPTVPGTLSRTLACSGNNRTVSLSWGNSSDSNFRGYRIYKSIDGGSWTVLATVSANARDDTDSKLYDSLRYYVVGYDKAGNESNATNTVSLAKNQCS